MASTESRVNPTDDSASRSSTVRQAADLSLKQTANLTTVRVGAKVTFTLTLTNLGPGTATNVRVSDLLPPGFQFFAVTLSVGSYNAGTGVWDVGSLAVGAKVTLKIKAKADGTVIAQVTNTAEVTALDQLDVNPLNNKKGLKVKIIR